MPAKFLAPAAVPTLVQERLHVWGRCIHAQRMRQRLTAADLAARMQVSRATLQRVERGDPGAAVATYLTALQILGVLDRAAPSLDPALWSDAGRQRVRRPGDDRDDDPF